MDSIDKLLAELKTEYTEPKTTPPQNNLTPVKLISSTTKSDVLIDNLLSEVQADLAENKTEYVQSNPTKPQNRLSPIQFVHAPDSKSDVFINDLLADVQADILAKDAAEALQKQEELTQEKIRQEKLQVKQKEALQKSAKQWLAKLDPLSSEGMWFEKFAEGYPNKLAAAIDYLQSNS
ncbi:salt stress protein, Slr1339 family [Dolichospermum compactum]|uniref:Uncharacterized protein n=1 Tax=Dolichospermum compactum NIES-806 TaxID=1973481 RepID=A0A1Z4UYP0_9CYAN|nr:hypothetical protein [Dolichospermum compactum]BAZ84219.1 hypothetical protein NIES806_04030 [Dolichospermum compactum NIES-806]